MATALANSNLQSVDREKIYLWITELTNPETRESALFELRYDFQHSLYYKMKKRFIVMTFLLMRNICIAVFNCQ